jgi:hypothetical protein
MLNQEAQKLKPWKSNIYICEGFSNSKLMSAHADIDISVRQAAVTLKPLRKLVKDLSSTCHHSVIIF